MAASLQIPDGKSLRTWEDAFAYPIPAVRRVEQQLRTDVSSNRERLRSLVGGSYRDLLGTADTIIDMDSRMHGVEAMVARIGRRCNSALMERTKIQSRQLMVETDRPQSNSVSSTRSDQGLYSTKKLGADYILASQLAVFKSCPDVVLRILKTKGSLLTAAKVLIISRILYRQLQAAKSGFEETIDAIFERVGRIRAKLLEVVNHRLSKLPGSLDSIIDAMCAYALASVASTADVLEHFLKVRLSAMITKMKHGKNHELRPVKALEAWLQTLRDVPSIFPRQLSQSLNKLKTEPLIKDEALKDIAALELDIHQTWLSDEIINFVPYVRHDDLDVATAKKQLSSWAPNAFDHYLKDLRSFLKPCEDLVEISKMRQDCLTAWFSGSTRIAGISRPEILDSLRKLFSEQLTSMTVTRCKALETVIVAIQDILKDWSDESSRQEAPALWHSDMIEMEVKHGAKKFTKNLDASLRGRTIAAERCLLNHQKWRQAIRDVEKILQDQRKIRWHDVGDDFDEDYEEDESRDQLLAKDDPNDLERTLKTATKEAIDGYKSSLLKTAGGLGAQSDASQKAAFLHRYLRETTHLLPSSYQGQVNEACMAKLAGPLAEPVVRVTVENYRAKIVSSLQLKQLHIRPLWSEDPQLPTVPSPWAVRAVKGCHEAMHAAGADLWTKSSVSCLKGRLLETLSGIFDEARSEAAKTSDADNDGDDDDKQVACDVQVQHIFDVEYLYRALSLSSDGSPTFEKHIELLAKSANLEASDRQLVASKADEYWKRTKLLFALLT